MNAELERIREVLVPVELLQRVEQFATEAALHYSAMNDEVCPSYCTAWLDAAQVSQELRAIIDKENT